jgi:hypothetical protein
MGLVVELPKLLDGRTAALAKGNFGIEAHLADPRHAVFIFGERAHGRIFIFKDLESGAGRFIKKGQHVAARDGSHEGLLGVYTFGIRIGRPYDRRGCRCLQRRAPVEGPKVHARVDASNKVFAGPLPMDGGLMVRHISRLRPDRRCIKADRSCSPPGAASAPHPAASAPNPAVSASDPAARASSGSTSSSSSSRINFGESGLDRFSAPRISRKLRGCGAPRPVHET